MYKSFKVGFTAKLPFSRYTFNLMTLSQDYIDITSLPSATFAILLVCLVSCFQNLYLHIFVTLAHVVGKRILSLAFLTLFCSRQCLPFVRQTMLTNSCRSVSSPKKMCKCFATVSSPVRVSYKAAANRSIASLLPKLNRLVVQLCFGF